MIVITAILCVLSFVAGLLVARNNVDRTESVVARTKKLLDALKGR